MRTKREAETEVNSTKNGAILSRRNIAEEYCDGVLRRRVGRKERGLTKNAKSAYGAKRSLLSTSVAAITNPNVVQILAEQEEGLERDIVTCICGYHGPIRAGHLHLNMAKYQTPI